MKKQNSYLPNLMILSAVLTLAFVATGCGVTTPATNSDNSTSTVSTNVNTSTKGNGLGNGNGNGNGNNASGNVKNTNTGSSNSGNGMMGNGGNGNGMMNRFAYKDGTYSANGEYFVEGKEVIGVSLTVQNDIITDVSVTPQARDKTSKGYQLMFVDNFKSQVIGKKIADLKLGKVSGASLTTQGFNNAVSIIKSQAAL